MTKFLIHDWYILLALLVVLAVLVINITAFAALPTKQQLAKVREWLLWAVIQAERELGGGTGKLKLRRVYDMFLQRFPQIAIVMNFDRFSKLVDEALDDMRELLESSHAVRAVVDGEKA